MIIFCGHFPDGALHFTEEEIEDETRAEWYLRQMLGAANFKGGPLLHILSGNLGFQIEHHLFPDLPSNRYAEISVRVRELCAKYDIPYTTGPLHRQYGQALRTIMKLSLPNGWTSSDQPEPPTPSRDRRRRADDERPVAAYRARRVVRGRPREAAGVAELLRLRPSPTARDGRRWVTQCALRRICGGCAMSLGRPVAFVGTADEVGRNAFHAPPLHVRVRRRPPRSPGADPDWQLVTTAGFEFVRPAREDADRRPTFQPNSLLWPAPVDGTGTSDDPWQLHHRAGELVVHDVQGRGRRPAAARLPGRAAAKLPPAQRDRRPVRVAHGPGRLGAAEGRRRAEAGGGRRRRGVRTRRRQPRRRLRPAQGLPRPVRADLHAPRGWAWSRLEHNPRNNRVRAL